MSFAASAPHTVQGLGVAEADRIRRRLLWSLVAGVGFGSTGYIAAITVASIVASDLAGTSAVAGLPGTAVVLGSAAGSALLSNLMVRRGRRFGLTLGYTVGALGALVNAFAIVIRSFPLLLVATLFMGLASSSNQLSRYAAADMYPLARRASALGVVVWGSTIGAVVGPNLITLAGSSADAFGLPRLAGPYLALVLFVGLGALLTLMLLRPDPYALADPSSQVEEGDVAGVSVRTLLRRPTVMVSLTALVIGQVVMVLIMTMTPLHMIDHGHDLPTVGLVLSAHTFGMYALSPASGWLTDRLGSLAVIALGLATLALAAMLTAVAPPDGGPMLFFALFLLGYGWNLGFVAGSALLASGLAVAERTRLQGRVDAVVWSSAAAASLSSGVVVAFAGFTALALIGLALVAAPAWLLVARRRELQAATA